MNQDVKLVWYFEPEERVFGTSIQQLTQHAMFQNIS